MGGVAAAASLFVSSSNSIQIVRRHCCLANTKDHNGQSDAEDQGILVFFINWFTVWAFSCLNDINFVINVLIPASNLGTYELIVN